MRQPLLENASDNYSAARSASSPRVSPNGFQSLSSPSHHLARLSDMHTNPATVEERTVILLAEIALKCAGSSNAAKAFNALDQTILKKCLMTYLETHSTPERNEISIKHSFYSGTAISFADFDYRKNMVSEGNFAYIPELKATDLVEGKITLSDEEIEEGKRAYIPELKTMSLVE
ncbi:MAG: hypothetical protein V4629_10935, partial [Pseudomonadota bacterium]